MLVLLGDKFLKARKFPPKMFLFLFGGLFIENGILEIYLWLMGAPEAQPLRGGALLLASYALYRLWRIL